MTSCEDDLSSRLGSRSLRAAVPLLLLAITALGASLRFLQISSKGLWLDESFSIWMGRMPLDEMLGRLPHVDQHPPLYYLLLHAWLTLGDGPGTVRALSALCSSLTVPAIFLLGKRLAGRWVGLLAALLLAVSPFHVHFAQEARMYALLTLSTSFAMVALAHLLLDRRAGKLRLGEQLEHFWKTRRETGAWRPLRTIQTDLAWLGYILFTVITMLSHNTAVFFPVAANIAALGTWVARRTAERGASGTPGAEPLTRPVSDRRTQQADPAAVRPAIPQAHAAAQGSEWPDPRFLRNWAIAQLAALLLWTPWLPSFTAQSAAVLREFWIPAPTWAIVAKTLRIFVSEFLPLAPAPANAVMAAYLALAALGAVHLARRRRAGGWLLVILLITPVAGELVVSLVRPIFHSRTLIWASIPLYLLLAAGIRRLRPWPLALAAILLALTANGLSLREYYVRFEKEGWDRASALVAEQAAPDDLILFSASYVRIPFDYYFQREGHPDVTELGVPDDLPGRQILGSMVIESDVPKLRALVGYRGRVWLVSSHDSQTDPRGLIPAALKEELHRHNKWAFYGVQVHLYTRE